MFFIPYNLQHFGGYIFPQAFQPEDLLYCCRHCQESPRLLWNQKFYCSVHKNPTLVLILSHMNPVHTLMLCFLKIYNNFFLSSTPWSRKLPLPFRFSKENFICISYRNPIHNHQKTQKCHQQLICTQYHKFSQVSPVCSDMH